MNTTNIENSPVISRRVSTPLSEAVDRLEYLLTLYPKNRLIDVALSSKSYYFEEVDNIFKARSSINSSTLLAYCDKYNKMCSIYIQQIDKKLNFNCEIKDHDCKVLYANGTDSKVGKGSKTVLDQKIRKSKEYSSDIDWDEGFLDMVKKCVETALDNMNAGMLVSLTPHKLLIYGEGDFFTPHMDSVHTTGQNMTCVVELSTNWSGAGLEINGIQLGCSSKMAKLFVFDHDLPHQIIPIEEGYRVSVTFDLVVDPIYPSEKAGIENTFKKMKSLGVKRFGFFATQRYLENQPLKGADARVVDVFSPYVTSCTLENLCTDDGTSWYLKNIWTVMNMGQECGVLMSEIEDSDDSESEDENHGENYFPPSPPTKLNPPETWKPTSNNSILSRTIREEYVLGDIFVLWSPHIPRHTMSGGEGIHLGNEGFSGDVHENLFVIMELK